MAIPKQKPPQPDDEHKHNPDQAWYWKKRWQDGEKKVEEHIRKSETETFESMDEFLASLDDE